MYVYKKKVVLIIEYFGHVILLCINLQELQSCFILLPFLLLIILLQLYNI